MRRWWIGRRGVERGYNGRLGFWIWMAMSFVVAAENLGFMTVVADLRGRTFAITRSLRPLDHRFDAFEIPVLPGTEPEVCPRSQKGYIPPQYLGPGVRAQSIRPHCLDTCLLLIGDSVFLNSFIKPEPFTNSPGF
jgi:hypothetical protein